MKGDSQEEDSPVGLVPAAWVEQVGRFTYLRRGTDGSIRQTIRLSSRLSMTMKLQPQAKFLSLKTRSSSLLKPRKTGFLFRARTVARLDSFQLTMSSHILKTRQLRNLLLST